MPVPVARHARRSVDPIQTVDQSPLGSKSGEPWACPDAAGGPSKELVINVAQAFHPFMKKRKLLNLGFFTSFF